MMHLPLVLMGLLAATAAVAQPAPPSPDVPQPPGVGPMANGGADADARPSPPPGGSGGPPRAGHPGTLPPPRGASFHIAHGADGGVRLDVECLERDATEDCAAIAGQMLDKLNVTQAK